MCKIVTVVNVYFNIFKHDSKHYNLVKTIGYAIILHLVIQFVTMMLMCDLIGVVRRYKVHTARYSTSTIAKPQLAHEGTHWTGDNPMKKNKLKTYPKSIK